MDDNRQESVCTCDQVLEHGDDGAQTYAQAHLVEVDRDVSGWTTTYRCPELGILWLEDWPWSEMHGGGPRRLRQFELVRHSLRSELSNVVVLFGDDRDAVMAAQTLLERTADPVRPNLA